MPQRVLWWLASNPELTLAEVVATMGQSLRAVERVSKKLADGGRLRYVGSKKGGFWEELK